MKYIVKYTFALCSQYPEVEIKLEAKDAQEAIDITAHSISLVCGRIVSVNPVNEEVTIYTPYFPTMPEDPYYYTGSPYKNEPYTTCTGISSVHNPNITAHQ